MDEGVIKELCRIQRANDNVLESEKVVEEARRPKSPLHGHFDWDDVRMAHRARLDVAEKLIRSFRVIYDKRQLKPVGFKVREGPPPRWTPHPSLERGYANTADLLAGPERLPVLRQEANRLAGHVRRFCTYLHAAGLGRLADRWAACLRATDAAVGEPPAAEAGD